MLPYRLEPLPSVALYTVWAIVLRPYYDTVFEAQIQTACILIQFIFWCFTRLQIQYNTASRPYYHPVLKWASNFLLYLAQDVDPRSIHTTNALYISLTLPPLSFAMI